MIMFLLLFCEFFITFNEALTRIPLFLLLTLNSAWKSSPLRMDFLDFSGFQGHVLRGLEQGGLGDC